MCCNYTIFRVQNTWLIYIYFLPSLIIRCCYVANFGPELNFFIVMENIYCQYQHLCLPFPLAQGMGQAMKEQKAAIQCQQIPIIVWSPAGCQAALLPTSGHMFPLSPLALLLVLSHWVTASGSSECWNYSFNYLGRRVERWTATAQT